MSTTTTTQTVPRYSIARTLADYDLHHSTPAAEKEGAGEGDESAQLDRNAEQGNNPPGWETEYRRVPPHRPVNRELDVASRSVTLNGVETFFVYNMFNGIRIVEVSAGHHFPQRTGRRCHDAVKLTVSTIPAGK
jgi:hypothetical protein